MRKPAAAIALALLLAVPLFAGAGLAVWALFQSPLESAAGVAPSIGEVEAAERADSVSTSIEYLPGESFPVATQSSGMITELDIEAETPIANGSAVMKVDGLPVTAYLSATPLHRDIGRGVRGDDVAVAQQLLVDLGYLDSDVDGVAGPATAAAITSFNAARGYGNNNAVLALGSLLWVPEGAATPGSVTVRAGANLEPGAELYTTTEGDAHVVVGVDASDEPRTLTVSDLGVDLAPGETVITDPDIVATIAEYLGGQVSMAATVTRADPLQVGTLPAAALVTDADGAVCFFSDSEGAGIVVEPTDGSFGMVDVDASLVGTPVLLNPRDVREDLACG